MKKTTIFSLIFASLLLVNASRATSGCYQSGNAAYCSATDGFTATRDFWVTPTGLDLQVYFYAYVPTDDQDHLAYGTANWASNSGHPYHYYGTGPYSGTIPYYSEAYGWLFEGWLNLTATTYGTGSIASVSASW
ncbi:hypothetical protein ACFQZS_16185 [Mucilaginibacter calamicampi]|uniref:Uncharacterized protein n=1 Tax=Mucilaginibacter calamicampi TaxID=1302352 RepID=A0ABW2YYX9_9SPHI